jgi:hypothetical protein
MTELLEVPYDVVWSDRRDVQSPCGVSCPYCYLVAAVTQCTTTVICTVDTIFEMILESIAFIVWTVLHRM